LAIPCSAKDAAAALNDPTCQMRDGQQLLPFEQAQIQRFYPNDMV
jgi:hypothetical protein